MLEEHHKERVRLRSIKSGQRPVDADGRVFLDQNMAKVQHEKSNMVVSIDGGTPITGCFIRENPINMDDLEVPPFMETTI